MVYVGDYFALGLVAILFMFFFEGKTVRRYMSAANKCFIACLMLTALTALNDLIAGHLLMLESVPLWANMLANTSYFIVNIITTSAFALFLFIKILEHAHDNHCMVYACSGLAALFVLYIALVIANLWNGWLFYFDATGTYCRGPLNATGYIVTVCQMGLVTVCYIRNRRNANRPMRRALLQVFPLVVLCIIIQRIYPEIMLNGFVMAFAAVVLFLSFLGQRQGVHSLTKLNDRHRFFKEVEQRIALGQRFQVFLINIKNFSVINQKYGHLFGDEFLYQFAFSLEKLIKKSMAFHMNGTVFSLILPYSDQTLAQTHSGIVLDFLEQDKICRDKYVSIDYVLVEYIADEHDVDAAEFYEKLEYAAALAYSEKRNYIRYAPNMGAEMNRIRYLQERLRTIDRAHGYEVWYQPIKCMSTGKFSSMEALVRLREPDGSLVSPGEFIPLAENTGLIAPLTWFVLEEVCDMLRRNPVLEGVSVSVNMPMPQLLDRGFLSHLNSIVNSAGISHSSICIEVTERAILDNFKQTLSIMEQIAEAGYRFYLDDFGTGYSNFNCLLQLPFRIIKLDSSLMHSGEKGQNNYNMVHTLTKMFHDMDLCVVSEGAETDEEVNELARLGVDRIQGFALARPMPEGALLEFYKNHI